MNPFARKSFKILMAMLLVYILLVATHKGEFWPFSIYPMFSQAGQPWTRALVQDVTETPDSLRWQTTGLENLHGPVVALENHGIEQIDFANFISKTENWDQGRKEALLKMFGSTDLSQKQWMVTKIKGRLAEHDSVTVKAIPFLLITRDSVIQNPQLSPTHYSSQNSDVSN